MSSKSSKKGISSSPQPATISTLSSNTIVLPLKVYCGFDPTDESLHLDNLLSFIVISWFHCCGHKAIALIGGATARVGDPYGKSLERRELDDGLESESEKERKSGEEKKILYFKG